MNKKRQAGAFWLPFLCLLLPLCWVGSLALGSVSLSFSQLWQALHEGPGGMSPESVIFWALRAPRGAAALAAGATLGVSGVLTQTLTGNPVAEPYLLGLSGGASAGAVGVIIFGFGASLGGFGTSLGAFLGAILSLAAVLTVAGRNPSPLRLVLVGMGVAALCGALTTFTLAQAHNDAQLRTAMYWTLGSLAAITWKDVPLLTAAAALTLFPALAVHRELDVMLTGDETARALGLPLGLFKPFVALLAALGVALLVSKTGVVGFVGLVAPHGARKLAGPTHKRLLPLAAVLGALLLLGADTAARFLFRPEELPVGVLTQAFGAPLFLWILGRDYRFGGTS